MELENEDFLPHKSFLLQILENAVENSHLIVKKLCEDKLVRIA
jgi:hypothetical protein